MYGFRAFVPYLPTYCCGRGIRFVSSVARSKRNNWDPTVSLELKHHSIVLLEKSSTRDHLKQILGQMATSGIIGLTFPMSRLIYYSAISHPENVDIALVLFSHYTPFPNLYIYNTMISALSWEANHSFAMYNSMLKSGIYPDKHTLLYLLRAAKCVSDVKQVHCHAIVTGVVSYGYMQNSLIKIYLENGLVWPANQVFERITTPDAVSFNIMIAGYAKKGYSLEAIQLFHDMVSIGHEPDDYTIVGLLAACAKLRDARLGKSVHAWLERRKSVTASNLILGNGVLDMYVKCEDLVLARRAFDSLQEKDIISWNTILSGCATCGELELAQNFFDEMPRKDVISWNSMIAGYAHGGSFTMVGNLLDAMVVEKVKPDNITMATLVSVAAKVGSLDRGKCIHGCTIRMRMKIDAYLGSALIDMYCKCGSIEKAFMVFQEVTEKDVALWTTMITGFAFHGYGSKALELFSAMQENVSPNEVTFISVLTACSHGGLIDEGIKIFNCMKYHGIEPGVEHYGCLIDLLARSGRLAEAKDVIKVIPMKPSRSIWGAILNACRAQEDVETAEMALTELRKLEPEEEGGYMLLSNTYAACGKWSYSNKVRKMMERRKLKKNAGYSSVVVDI